MYCVLITTCYPDHKMPSTRSWVTFFKNKTDAEKYIKDEKRKYYNYFGVHCENIDPETDPDQYDEEAEEIIYGDAYMENEPFSWEIIDVSAVEIL
jgi:hypothetical protein